MAAAAIWENGRRPPLLRFLNSECDFQSVQQISSKSGHICPFSSNQLIFKMTALAILENGRTLPVLFFLTQHAFLSLCTKFHHYRATNGRVTHLHWFGFGCFTAHQHI
jgi:hypothetical protein